MKVSELITELQCFDEDAEVHMAYGAGDYWKSTLAPKVRTVFNGTVQYATYHQSDKLVDSDDIEESEDGEEEEFPVRKVVIIE
jgi:hypothetical protein